MKSTRAYNDNNGGDLHVLDILNEMRQSKIESTFICSLMQYCQQFDGIRDLMELWSEETNSKERAKIIADLQDALDDIISAHNTPEERPYLHFDNLNDIRNEVVEFKKQLREEVDRHGGISELARKTGIPQPSLSRFFTSVSMPRRTTLYKIAKALNLPESAVGFKWSR